MSEHIAEDIRAVFFDHDDTLVDTIGTKWAQHKHIANVYYGKNLSDEEIREHWGIPLNELVCALYGTDDVETAIGYTMIHHEEFPKHVFPESAAVLRRIHAAGKLVGIITATNRFSFEHDLTLHNMPRESIDYTQTADDTPFHKPDPRVFNPAIAWLEEQSVTPNQVVYIGDGLHDMHASLGAGFNFLGVETGLVTAEQFKEHGAKSIPSIANLDS